MDNNPSHSKGNVCLDPNVCGIWQGMTSFVNKDVSIYQGILLPLWMCWLFSPISFLMTWAEQSIHLANVQNSEKGAVWDWSSFKAARCRCSFSEITSPLQLSEQRSEPKCYFIRTLFKEKKNVFSIILWIKEAFRRLLLGQWGRKIKGKWVRLILVAPSGVQNICVRRSDTVKSRDLHSFRLVLQTTALYPTHSHLLGSYRKCAFTAVIEQSNLCLYQC